MIYAFPKFDQFMAFVVERHRIYERRAAGKPAPWTKDPILRKYRFCNVYRELDRVTQWITTHWREPHDEYEHLWFAMVVARLVNHPETLVELSLPGRWNKREFVRVLHHSRSNGEKTFGSAYIVSTNGIAKDKAEYLAESVLDPMWTARSLLKPQLKDTLRSFNNRLLSQQGMGSFMAAQVVADLKYTYPLLNATDWWTFAASGPGSRRGMSYLMGFDPRMRWNEHEWKESLNELMILVRPRLKFESMPRMHQQDLQNCLCEFSKMCRVLAGGAPPRQKFVPHGESHATPRR